MANETLLRRNDSTGAIAPTGDVSITGRVYTSETINAMNGFGLVADGVTENFVAFGDFWRSVQPSGGITSIIVAAPGTGYDGNGGGAGAFGALDITFSGGSGAGAAGKAVISDNGRVAFATITNPGSGYKIVAREVGATGIVSGSPVITINAGTTTDISAGMSVTSDYFSAGTTVLSKTSNTVTVSTNATGSAGYQWVSFGIPQLSFSGGGSGAVLKAVVGTRKHIVIPPGNYVCAGTYIHCLHNAYVEATGVTLIQTSKTSNGLYLGPECCEVVIDGLRDQNYDTTSVDPTARGTGIGFKLSGYNVELHNTGTRNIPNWGVVIQGEGATYNRGLKVINHSHFGSGGDGIHVADKVDGVHIVSPNIYDAGDDGIAVYGTDDSSFPPLNISVDNFTIVNNGWRGLMVGANASRVSFGNGVIRGCGNYAIECFPGDGPGSTGPSDITFGNIVISGVGRSADGYRATYSNRYPIKINKCTRVYGGVFTFSDIQETTLVNIVDSTDIHFELGQIGSKTAMVTSGSNSNCSVNFLKGSKQTVMTGTAAIGLLVDGLAEGGQMKVEPSGGLQFEVGTSFKDIEFFEGSVGNSILKLNYNGVLQYGVAASTASSVPSTHKIAVKDNTGTVYYLLATT